MIDPGPTLDALVARKLWGAVVIVDVMGKTAHLIGEDRKTPVRLPSYSTEVAAAHRVVGAMQQRGWTAYMKHDDNTGKFFACFSKSDGRTYKRTPADTLAHAVCLAALDALMGKNIVP